MTRAMVWFGALAGLVLLPAAAPADWFEDFDSYELGSSMHGQGGWKGWNNNSQWEAFVTDAQSRSNPHSVDIVLNADLIHEFEGYDSGTWIFTAWQYIPSDFVGQSYFILLNKYSDGNFPPDNWSTQIRFDSALGKVASEFEEDMLDLIYDQWVEIRVEIDLVADWQQIYYGGQLLSEKSWTDGVSGGGDLNIDTVDLFANGATSVYYDDLSLAPPPTECVGDVDGDGDTDQSDLGILLSAWGCCVGDGCYVPEADLDSDGCVGQPDLGILLADWGCGT